ncbi:unnamed protein product [Didymodactylos carnosus]|uniref:CAF17 C-terminal domain-containing protein n=1 Tax=Didymodactylos carnosus TaxID=1234261 RepID=A0A813WGJ5_9BILA|nr:unnamed protein product [Didymodactylos carnosus]CAF1248365.1 unnamed protein product [Didymodactylos carnosus]CAF3642399.1 unnamed protein product [Didymodactylos carnosus]CAF4055960.1 unnamed protein product [Didymodactylos carnosus]
MNFGVLRKCFNHTLLQKCLSIESCRKLNSTCTAIPLDHRGLIHVTGKDSSPFLQGLITNDITFLNVEHEHKTNALYSMILNARGRVLYDMIVYRPMTDDHLNNDYLLEVSLNAVADIIRFFRKHKLRKNVDLIDVTQLYRIWSIFPNEPYMWNNLTNEDVREKLNFKTRDGLIIGHSDPRHYKLGIRIITERQTNISSLTDNCKEEQNITLYKKWLYKNGVAEGTDDIPSAVAIPLEYNIVFLNGVSFSKGCYIGQELIARTHHTGVVRKRIMPVKIDNYATLANSFSSTPSNDVEEKLDHEVDDETNKQHELSIINVNTKRSAGKLRSHIENEGIALIRLNGWDNELRIQNGDVSIKPYIPSWWPPLDEATKLEMRILDQKAVNS